MHFASRTYLFAALTTALTACGDNNKAVVDAAKPDARAIDAAVDAPPATPTSVTNFTATAGPAKTIKLAWTNPTMPALAGVLVVVSKAPITFAPVDGTAYTVAQSVGTDQTVMAIANATAADFTPAAIGTRYQFAAWAFNVNKKYSPIALTSGVNNLLGAQTGTISVDLATLAVTTTTQPTDINIENTTTATYDPMTQTLKLQLGVRNKTNRLLFNLKALSSMLSQGTQAGTVFPPTGAPMTFFSNFGVAPDATITQTVTITNVNTAMSPFTMKLDFADAPALLLRGNIFDTGGAGNSDGFRINGGVMTAGQISNDGSKFYGGVRNTNALSIIDLSTARAPNVEVPLTTAVADDPASIGALVLNRDNSKAFIAFNDGAHYQGTDSKGGALAPPMASVQLIEFATATNTETRRLQIVPAGDTSRAARHVTLSPDGKKAAILVTGARTQAQVIEVYFVDLETFTVIDTDANTAGIQPVSLPIATDPDAHRFADEALWDGNKLFVEHIQHHRTRNAAQAKVPVAVIDTTTFTKTELVPDFGSDRACGLAVVDGKLYYCSGSGNIAFSGGITVFDLAANTQSQLSTVRARFMAVDGQNKRLYTRDFSANGIRVFDLATNTEVYMDNDAGNGSTPIGDSTPNGHVHVVTPF